MASSDVPPLLPHDLERVIQQALLQANDSLRSESLSAAKKTKKRNRECAPEENESSAKEPKQKKKKKVREHVAEVIAGGPEPVSTTTTEDGTAKKRKKKGKKARDPPQPQEIQIDPALQNLSATPPPPAPKPLPPPAPVHAEADSSNFLPPELRHVFATGGPLNTNEDILRALQDLDITKITGALQSLGEVAAANHISLPSLNTRPLSPRPIRQTAPKPPATNTATSQTPPQQTSSTPAVPQQIPAAADRQPVVPRPSFVARPPPASSQNQNPEHAYMLYTKWLNASKLKELAGSIGLLLSRPPCAHVC